MKQPKRLEELARMTINKHIKAGPHLRELALPPRLIREVERYYLHYIIELDKELKALFEADYRLMMY